MNGESQNHPEMLRLKTDYEQFPLYSDLELVLAYQIKEILEQMQAGQKNVHTC